MPPNTMNRVFFSLNDNHVSATFNNTMTDVAKTSINEEKKTIIKYKTKHFQ